VEHSKDCHNSMARNDEDEDVAEPIHRRAATTIAIANSIVTIWRAHLAGPIRLRRLANLQAPHSSN